MSFPRKLPTHLLIALTSALGVWGCGKTNINAQGFGGSDQWAVLTTETPVKLAAVIHRLRTEGDPSGYLCNVSFCGSNPFVCAQLTALAASTAENNFVRNSMLDDASLSSLEGGLATMQPSITSEESEVSFGGGIQDALTLGKIVKFLRQRISGKSFGDFLALVYHEATHVAGVPDAGAFGPYAQRRQGIDARAACLVPYTLNQPALLANAGRKDPIGGTTPPTGGSANGGIASGAPTFRDDFDRTELGANWMTLLGGPVPSGGALINSSGPTFDALYAGAGVSNVKAAAEFNLSEATPNREIWGELYARGNKSGFRYSGRATMLDGRLTVGIWKRESETAAWINVMYKPIGNLTAEEASQIDIRIEAQGSDLRLYYRNALQFTVTDAPTGEYDNWIGIRGGDRAKVNFFSMERL